MISEYDEGHGLAEYLRSAIDDYSHARVKFWFDAPGTPGEYILTIADLVGATVLRIVDDLVFPDSGRKLAADLAPEVTEEFRQAYAEGKTAKAVLDELDQTFAAGQGHIRAFGLERIQIDLALRLSADLEMRAERCVELTRYVMSTDPSPAVRKYLRHLSRSYVTGADPACVMLCRAVLDNALIDRFARTGIPVPATPEGKSDMAVRIDFARKVNWLSHAASVSAHTVRDRGNKAVHEDPEATRDVLDTIDKTMAVVAELYS